MGSAKLVMSELKGCLAKNGEERVDGLSQKIVKKSDDGKIEEELVRSELMGSTENGRKESRIIDPWCGSGDAGWRVAAEKMIALMGSYTGSLRRRFWFCWPDVKSDGASTGNGDDSQKLDTKATLVTVVSALAVLLKQLNLKALKASDDGATLIAQMASMASMASTEMVALMESKETLMASMVWEAPTAMLDLASLAFLAARVWVTDLNRRKLSYEMLKF